MDLDEFLKNLKGGRRNEENVNWNGHDHGNGFYVWKSVSKRFHCNHNKASNTKKMIIRLMEIKQTPVAGGVQFESVIYQIVLDKNGKKLIPYIGKDVKVTGLFRIIKGTKYIKVKSFELVKE